MAYEELKRDYNRYKNVASEAKLVSHWAHEQVELWEHALHAIKSEVEVCGPSSSSRLLKLFLCIDRILWNISQWRHYPKSLPWPQHTLTKWCELACKTSTTVTVAWWMSSDGRGGAVLDLLKRELETLPSVLQSPLCLLRNEGAAGFYKGIIPNVIRVTPACCITFVVYENVSEVLLRRNKWVFSSTLVPMEAKGIGCRRNSQLRWLWILWCVWLHSKERAEGPGIKNVTFFLHFLMY